MRILITGASGFIGRHVAMTLRNEGHRVIAFSRGGPDSFEAGVFAGPSRLAEIDRWQGWPENIDALVHLAAKTATPRNQRLDAADGFRDNVEGTRALAARARRERVKRIVFVSTATVHGLGRAAPYSETDPLDPPTPYARSKKAAEQAFWHELGSDRGAGTVLRPPPVFGRGGHGLVAALVRLSKTPAPLPLKGIGAPRSLIAVDHLTAIVVLCLTHEAARGETFLVADDGPVCPQDIVRAVRQGLNRQVRLMPAPARLLAMGANAIGRSDIWETRTLPCLIDATLVKARLGWTSPTPVPEKLQMLAADGSFG